MRSPASRRPPGVATVRAWAEVTRQTVLVGGDVVTMNPDRDVLLGGSVVIDGDRIVAVGSTTELLAAHPDAVTVDVSGCVVTPGMIDAHQHLTGDPLVRCCIPDLLPSGAAIFDWSVPLHDAHESRDDEVSAMVAAVEAVLNGVTTVVEAGTVADGHAVARGLQAVGLRATIGVWGWDIEVGPYAALAPEVLDRQRAMVEAYPTGGLVEGWVTLVGHDLASDASLGGAADLARELGTGMTMHLSPTSSDPERYLERTGRRPVEHLADLGVLGEHLLIGHGVWLDDAEVDLVLSSRARRSPTVPGRTCGSARGSSPTRATPRSSNEAAGSHSAVTPRTQATRSTCCAPLHSPRGSPATLGLDPTRFGAHAGVRARNDCRCRRDRPRRPDRLDRVRQTGRPRGARHRHARLRPRVARSPPNSSGAPTAVPFATCSSRDARSSATVESCTVDTDALYAEAAERQRDLLERADLTVLSPWPHRDAT